MKTMKKFKKLGVILASATLLGAIALPVTNLNVHAEGERATVTEQQQAVKVEVRCIENGTGKLIKTYEDVFYPNEEGGGYVSYREIPGYTIVPGEEQQIVNVMFPRASFWYDPIPEPPATETPTTEPPATEIPTTEPPTTEPGTTVTPPASTTEPPATTQEPAPHTTTEPKTTVQTPKDGDQPKTEEPKVKDQPKVEPKVTEAPEPAAKQQIVKPKGGTVAQTAADTAASGLPQTGQKSGLKVLLAGLVVLVSAFFAAFKAGKKEN